MKPGTSGRLFLLIVFITSFSSKAGSQDTTKQYPVLFAQAFVDLPGITMITSWERR